MTHNFSDDELNYLTPEDDKGKDEDGGKASPVPRRLPSILSPMTTMNSPTLATMLPMLR